MKKSNIAIGFVVVVIIAAGAYVLTRKDNTSTSTITNQSQPSSTTASTNQSPNTITLTGRGFNPSTLTVKTGDKVTVKNDSSSEMQFQSNPHPAHTDNPELNVGVVAPGKSATFTATAKGTWGYHNHLSIGNTGTLVVE